MAHIPVSSGLKKEEEKIEVIKEIPDDPFASIVGHDNILLPIKVAQELSE